MTFILFDDERFDALKPFTHTRPVSEIRCGMMTIREKWEHVVAQPVYVFTKEYLMAKYGFECSQDNIMINAGLMPDAAVFEAIVGLKKGQVLLLGNMLLAARVDEQEAKSFSIVNVLSASEKIMYEKPVAMLSHLWDIFSMNDAQLRVDYDRLTRGRVSAKVSDTNTVIGNQLFLEEGARIEASIINTITGPVYVAKDAEVMEGCMIRGPFALGEHAVLKMGAKVYGASTLGEGCKVGGEINNVVFFANSNKAHDGFLGNAVIGEWCNLGADSNNSNLKNNYEEVKLWSEDKNTFVKTGLQFCGLIMGDHSKCGINTMFNTGTVVGVSCNIFGAGFPRNFIPSFSWGGASGITEYQLQKAIETASKVFARRGKDFDEIERSIFSHVHTNTSSQRSS